MQSCTVYFKRGKRQEGLRQEENEGIKNMFRIKALKIHHETKGESHPFFCMNLVPLLHIWSDGISLGDRATTRHLEVPSIPHLKRSS